MVTPLWDYCGHPGLFWWNGRFRSIVFSVTYRNLGARKSSNPLAPTIQLHVHTARPVGDRTRPVGDRTRPVGDRTRPVGDRTRPVSDRTRPVGDRTRPVGDRTRPVGDRTRSVGDRTRPVGDGTRPVSDRTRPVGDTAASLPLVYLRVHGTSSTPNFRFAKRAATNR